MRQVKEKLDFGEIRPNFFPQQAKLEAERCLYCYDAPCRTGCPVNIDIPHFIQSIRSGNLKRAARLINDANPMGSICGRVCPVERLCEEKCTAKIMTGKPVAIAMLQRFAVDNGNYTRQPVQKNGIKVAVIGSGPAGLSCASELARHGYEVTVFESKSNAGGMVSFGVPEYRCPHGVTAIEVLKIEKEGVEVRTSTPVNQSVSQLFNLGYEAVFVAVGLTRTSRPEIPGIDLKGVYLGLDFLNRISSSDPPEVGKKVIVVGGGDTAVDCARSALRLGAEEVTIMYRRSFVEMPADKVEIEEALDEGIIFRTLTQPVALHGDAEKVLRAVEAVSVKLGPPDKSGRRSPVEIKDSNYRLACNTFIFATGTEPSKLLKRILPDAVYEMDTFPRVNPKTFETSVAGVFAGGDVVNRGATVVQAIAEGKAAAHGIMEYLESRRKPFEAVAGEEEKVEEKIEALPEVELKAEEAAVVEKVEVPDFEVGKEEVLEEEEEIVTTVEEENLEISQKREELKKKWKEKLSRKQKQKLTDADKESEIESEEKTGSE